MKKKEAIRTDRNKAFGKLKGTIHSQANLISPIQEDWNVMLEQPQKPASVNASFSTETRVD